MIKEEMVKILEQEPCEDAISRQAVLEVQAKYAECMSATSFWKMRDEIREVAPVAENDDAISRQAVDTLVDELARAISDERCCMSRGRSTATIMQDILDLPSVTPKQKMGHWTKKENEICFTCNQCWTTNASGVKYNFCPNCGAKMTESEDKKIE